MAQIMTLIRGSAPHLKSEASFIFDYVRSLGAAMLFVAAGFWKNGFSAAALFGVMIVTASACELILRAAGFKSRSAWDAEVFRQAALLALFLPANLPLAAACLSAAVLSIIYRISGGQAGLTLPPVCIALAFTAMQGYTPVFLLNDISAIPALILFAAWNTMLFSGRRIQVEKTVSVLLLAAMTAVLHDMPVWTALIWSATAGEVIFDGAFLPADSRLRLIARACVLVLMLLFTAVSQAEEALIFGGLAAALAAAVIENRVGSYGKK